MTGSVINTNRASCRFKRPTGHTVIASHKRIPIVLSELAVDIFLRFFQCDIHVTIDGLEFPFSETQKNSDNPFFFQGGAET